MTLELEARAVTFGYEPDTTVLNHVEARVRCGGLTGIVGPNGSGKSTLLRLLSGNPAPDRGEILLGGKLLRSYPARQRARMLAFLPQTVTPAFSLSAFEVVCLGRYPHSGGLGALRQADLDVAARCMRETNTEDLRKRDFGTLSGGERQRVLLASVLAQEPRLVLLDEPTSALDIHHQVEVFELLARLRSQDYGVAVVVHDLNLAAQYCDTMILLGLDHAVRANGAPETVLTAAHLSAAYGAAVDVGAHPFAGTPFVSARPERDAHEA